MYVRIPIKVLENTGEVVSNARRTLWTCDKGIAGMKKRLSCFTLEKGVCVDHEVQKELRKSSTRLA